MAKTSVKIAAQNKNTGRQIGVAATRKGVSAYEAASRLNSNARWKGLRQSERSAAIQRQMKNDLKISKLKANQMPKNILAAGGAVAQATTPIAGAIGSYKTTQAIENRKIAETVSRKNDNEALNKWLQNVSGNPTASEGSNGSTQGGTTTDIVRTN